MTGEQENLIPEMSQTNANGTPASVSLHEACLPLRWCRLVTYTSVRSAGDSECEEVRTPRIQAVDCTSENMHVCNPYMLVTRWPPPLHKLGRGGLDTKKYRDLGVPLAQSASCLAQSQHILLDHFQRHLELDGNLLFRPHQKSRKDRGCGCSSAKLSHCI